MAKKMIIFSAPSGSGKTTILKQIMPMNPSLEFSISACSREKRDNEIDGVDYYFIGTENFKERIVNNEFVEWEEVYKDNFYGTLNQELERIWGKGKSVIFDLDVKGGINLKKLFGDTALSIFIMPPGIDILKERLKNRGTESEESIEKRIARAEFEIDLADKFDIVVVNNNLEQAVIDIDKIIKKFI